MKSRSPQQQHQPKRKSTKVHSTPLKHSELPGTSEAGDVPPSEEVDALSSRSDSEEESDIKRPKIDKGKSFIKKSAQYVKKSAQVPEDDRLSLQMQILKAIQDTQKDIQSTTEKKKTPHDGFCEMFNHQVRENIPEGQLINFTIEAMTFLRNYIAANTIPNVPIGARLDDKVLKLPSMIHITDDNYVIGEDQKMYFQMETLQKAGATFIRPLHKGESSSNQPLSIVPPTDPEDTQSTDQHATQSTEGTESPPLGSGTNPPEPAEYDNLFDELRAYQNLHAHV